MIGCLQAEKLNIFQYIKRNQAQNIREKLNTNGLQIFKSQCFLNLFELRLFSSSSIYIHHEVNEAVIFSQEEKEEELLYRKLNR